MTLDEFRESVARARPPDGLAPALVALWHDARGDWEAAHRVAQDVDDRSGAWVHAYLHRKEGDQANAAYWYRRARQPVAREPLAEEWSRIADALLSAGKERS